MSLDFHRNFPNGINMTTPHTDSWEEEFEMFSDYIKPISVGQYAEKGINIGFLSSKEVIKDFIKTVEQRAYEKGRKDERGNPLFITSENGDINLTETVKQATLSERQRIREVIESKKKLEVGVSPEALMWKQRWNRDMDILLSHLEDKEITICTHTLRV